MTVIFSEYCKNASMWNKTRTFSAEIENPCRALSILGFKKTSYGAYWKQTAYNEATEAVVK